jgi:hypothetical protein
MVEVKSRDVGETSVATVIAPLIKLWSKLLADTTVKMFSARKRFNRNPGLITEITFTGINRFWTQPSVHYDNV